jgi:hypothetical protein
MPQNKIRNMTSKLRLSITYLFCFVFWFCNSLFSVSAQAPDSAKKWHVLTDIYLMAPYMKGETGVSDNIVAPVDATPGDIFDKLKMAAMLYIEVQHEKWSITSDLVYMSLNQEVTPGTVLNSGTVSAKEIIWEPAGFYRVFSFLDIGAGGRLNNIQTETDVRRNVFPAGTEELTGNHAKTWFDPILITRLKADIHDKWLFQFRGDLGGFGVGSDFTWQLQAYAGYRFSKLFQLTAGYRILSIDYDKGTDKERFIYNMDTFGPVIRLGFNF